MENSDRDYSRRGYALMIWIILIILLAILVIYVYRKNLVLEF